MKLDKYIGMDVHQATTVVVVLDANGKVALETIVATEAARLIRLIQSLNGPLHVTFEETTQAGWLYDPIRAYAQEVVVCDPRRNRLRSEASAGNSVAGRFGNRYCASSEYIRPRSSGQFVVSSAILAIPRMGLQSSDSSSHALLVHHSRRRSATACRCPQPISGSSISARPSTRFARRSRRDP